MIISNRDYLDNKHKMYLLGQLDALHDVFNLLTNYANTGKDVAVSELFNDVSSIFTTDLDEFNHEIPENN